MHKILTEFYFGQPKFFYPFDLLQLFKGRPCFEHFTNQFKRLKKKNKKKKQNPNFLVAFQIKKEIKKNFPTKKRKNKFKKKTEKAFGQCYLNFLLNYHIFHSNLKLNKFIVGKNKFTFFSKKFSLYFPVSVNLNAWIFFWKKITFLIKQSSCSTKKTINSFLKMFFF
jgi:hypothetical protein